MYQDPGSIDLLDQVISGRVVVSEADWRRALAAGIQDIRAKQLEQTVINARNEKRLAMLEESGKLWRWLGGQVNQSLPFILSAGLLGLFGLVLGFVTGHLHWVP